MTPPSLEARRLEKATAETYRYALFIAIKHLQTFQIRNGVYETVDEIRDKLIRNAEKEIKRHKKVTRESGE